MHALSLLLSGKPRRLPRRRQERRGGPRAPSGDANAAAGTNSAAGGRATRTIPAILVGPAVEASARRTPAETCASAAAGGAGTSESAPGVGSALGWTGPVRAGRP